MFNSIIGWMSCDGYKSMFLVQSNSVIMS